MNVYAQRAGRVAFGVMLSAGAVLLALCAPSIRRDDPLISVHAHEIVLGAWVVAFAVGIGVYSVMRAFPMPRSGDALRREALAAPAVGLALLLPITLHLLVIGDDVRGFDEWVYFSVLFTSHTHIVFALLVASRALALASNEKPLGVGFIYALVCGVALIPIGIPMFYVAITGIPIVPLLVWMKRVARIDLERSREIPFAIARTV